MAGKRRSRNYHLDQLLFPDVEFLHIKEARIGSLMVAVNRFRQDHGKERLKEAGIGGRLHYAIHPDGCITIWKKPFSEQPKPIKQSYAGKARFVMGNPKQYDDLFVDPALKEKVEKARKVQKTQPEKTLSEIVRTPVYEVPKEPSGSNSNKKVAHNDSDEPQGLFEDLLFE